MCGSTKAPAVVQRDPVAEAKAAEATATKTSNSDLAQRRRQRAQNSLLTRGAGGTASLLNTPFADAAKPQRGIVGRQPGDNLPAYKRDQLDRLGG
jgi:hypothetical protein